MRTQTKRRVFTSFGVLLLLILAFVIFFWMNFKTVIVSGPSMLPTLKNGQRVLVSKAYWLVGAVKKGDVVVLSEDSPLNPSGFIIKRVYRMAGEEVDRINQPRSVEFTEQRYKVPDKSIYVLGDNREQSEDSRVFGAVEVSRILGKVVIWP